MKKIFILLSLGLMLIVNSRCKKSSIDKPIFGTQSNVTFYQSDSQIGQALTGTYLQLRVTWNEWAKDQYFVGDISTDDAWKGGANDGDYAPAQDMSNFVLNPTNDLVNVRWTLLYGLISRANEVIFYAPNATGDKALLARYVNEAKLLRAFGYYHLLTVYGGVPLVLKPLTPGQATTTPRSTAAQIYAQIVLDLTDATALPARNQYAAANQFRVTSGLAWTLLGKVHMFELNYAQAEVAFAKVVQSGAYTLLADYGANWRIDNSTESVFEMNNQMVDKDVALGSNIPLFFMTRNTGGYSGYGFHCPTTDLYAEFDKDDPRISYTFTMTGDRFINDTPVTQDQDNSDSPSGFHDRKTFVPQYLQVLWYPWMVSYNVRLIRYDDVLLLYAEALNENGKPDQALTYLNQIRTRARLTPPKDILRSKQAYVPPTSAATLPAITTTNQASLRLAIWHERRLELAMEGLRRDDLVRQKRFGTVMRAFAANYATLKGKNFMDNRDYLFPIPQNEIDYSNRVIVQNPNF